MQRNDTTRRSECQPRFSGSDILVYTVEMELNIENDAHCFCCGPENDRGLHLRFSYPAPGEAEASLQVPEYFSGWKRTAHGGFLSMLLDEAMAHACLRADGADAVRTGVTAEMTVRFKKPVETGSRLRVAGKVVEIKGRILSTQGWVYGEDGEVAAEAKARFLASKQ
jgi:uncharacterized protein (TIGR00369 family)